MVCVKVVVLPDPGDDIRFNRNLLSFFKDSLNKSARSLLFLNTLSLMVKILNSVMFTLSVIFHISCDNINITIVMLQYVNE